MEILSRKAKLPGSYQTYIFDLYGTLVDIHTEEEDPKVWEKLALFMGYYKADYTPEALKAGYKDLVQSRERRLKSTLEQDPKYTHAASPEIDLMEVFRDLYASAGIQADEALIVHTGQFFRVLSTEYVRLYEGTREILQALRDQGKRVYLLSNAQRIFTAYEMQALDLEGYFDDILISSDYQTKKPDERFFRILLEKHAIDPRQALFVGNDSRTDIAGAQQVGLDTYYIYSNISPAGDTVTNATYCVPDFEKWVK